MTTDELYSVVTVDGNTVVNVDWEHESREGEPLDPEFASVAGFPRRSEASHDPAKMAWFAKKRWQSNTPTKKAALTSPNA